MSGAEMPGKGAPARPGRILFLDGLRGIASLAVAVYHIVRPAVEPLSGTAHSILSQAFLGVPVFFVVSGFAIAQSLEGLRITAPATGRFLVRRICRLDPPYWASMLVSIAVAMVAQLVLHEPRALVLTWKVVLANVLYLQYILGITSLADTYWTLTFEIQFYLLLALLVGITQRLEARVSSRTAFALVFGPILVYSLLTTRDLAPMFTGSCIKWWGVFFLGVAAQRLVSRNDLPTFVLTLVAFAVGGRWGLIFQLVVLGVVALIAFGHARGLLSVWLGSRFWQYLGRISYSLYLTHWVVGARFANLLNRLLHPSPTGRILTSLVGVGAAVAFAHVFWWAIERPSLKLSRHVAVRTSRPEPVVAAA